MLSELIRHDWRSTKLGGVLGDIGSSLLALDVTNLTVRYGGFEAVNGLNLEVPARGIRGLIGPNGAGKTSSFNAICGEVAASGGQIRIHGRRMTRVSPYRAWRAGVGRTFQRVELFWTLTVRDHLELAQRRAAKLGRDSPSPDQLLTLLGLDDVAGAVVATLPLGTCRLVEFGRAIATGADLILLDEPCSGLDGPETSHLKSAIQLLQSELGLSLLIVEHDIEFILSIAERISVLSNGRLIAEGVPEDVRKSAAVRTAYLGRASEVGPQASDRSIAEGTE
jgi:ABC-type branched-subunit amino acid transport system ATPase component